MVHLGRKLRVVNQASAGENPVCPFHRAAFHRVPYQIFGSPAHNFLPLLPLYPNLGTITLRSVRIAHYGKVHSRIHAEFSPQREEDVNRLGIEHQNAFVGLAEFGAGKKLDNGVAVNDVDFTR